MKNRREDELIQLAFGELRGTEAERLSASLELGSADAALVEEMAALRDDLKLLSVPAHQLSTERLRDAILNQGLHPKRTSGLPQWFKFAMTPALTLAVAYVITVSLNRPGTSDPVIAMGGNEPSHRQTDSIFVQPGGSDAASESLSPGLMGAKSPESTQVSNPSPNRRGQRTRFAMGSRGLGTREAVVSPEAGAAMVANAVVVSAGSSVAPAGMNDSAMVKGASVDSAPQVDQPTIVLIGNDRDAQTGANKAVEVSSTSNVVTGG